MSTHSEISQYANNTIKIQLKNKLPLSNRLNRQINTYLISKVFFQITDKTIQKEEDKANFQHQTVDDKAFNVQF